MLPYNPHLKRGLDILISLAALLLLSAPFVVLCVFICLDSDGGPFFFQRRIGKGLLPFRLIKFRSMKKDVSAYAKEFEPGDRRRLTRLGGFMRRTKVDELPQLFNVLFGDLSIVGPRPEVAKYVRDYSEEFKSVLEVRPGLTDFASIKYCNEEAILAAASEPEKYYVEKILPDKLDLAKKYVRMISLQTDMMIVGNTVRSLFLLKGNDCILEDESKTILERCSHRVP